MSDPVEIARQQTEFMFEIGRKETAIFENDSVTYTETVLLSSGRRGIMVWVYCLLRNYKKIVPIEDLDRETKNKMWAFVKEICAGKTNDVQRMKHICMVFYAIEYFINEKQ